MEFRREDRSSSWLSRLFVCSSFISLVSWLAYLNLLYRRRADTVASENEREQLMKIADDLLDRVKDIKQKRSETSSQP